MEYIERKGKMIMEGKEPRTKLVCNLNMEDFFTIQGVEGVWRRTPQKFKRDGKMLYICKMMEDGKKEFWIQGTRRVTLIDRED